MRHKLTQQLKRERYTSSNRLPAVRSRQFLINAIRFDYSYEPDSAQAATLGFLRLHSMEYYAPQNRIANRSSCFLTGRGRGTSSRYGISRLQIKHLSWRGKLIGARKSSW